MDVERHQRWIESLEARRPAFLQEELQKLLGAIRFLGVQRLSNLESFQIRRNIERLHDERIEFGKRHGFMTVGWNYGDPWEEALAQFLIFYGINPYTVCKYHGDTLWNTILFDKQGREYLRIKLKESREQAHKPYLDESEP